MTNEEVKRLLGDTPYMSLPQAECLAAFIEEHAVEDVLELGFAHGVSTCYIAATLGRMGSGHVVTIDLEQAKKRTPSIHELLARTGQSERVTVHFEPTSYNWRLMKFLEQEPRPKFDLCYLDGAHTWFVDGLAFYLVHLLLKPGGWIVFDDLEWTYAESPNLRDTERVRRMPEDERTTPQIRKVYELLVKRHPQYHNFRTQDGWSFAQKKRDSSDASRKREVVTEEIVRIQKEYYGLGGFLLAVGGKLWRYRRLRAERRAAADAREPRL
jgi:predicted O-methyltransferase YrrM